MIGMQKITVVGERRLFQKIGRYLILHTDAEQRSRNTFKVMRKKSLM